MTTQFSLAHLTMLECSPPQLIEIAAQAGYDYVSLRPIPVGAPNEPMHPFATDRALFERTKAALAATGLRLLDIEVARIVEGVSPNSYLPAIAAAAELGGKHVLSSAWCDDGAYIVDFFARLCELARPFGLTVDLEFVTWSGVKSLGEAGAVVTAANCPNAGILIDTLHFDRSHARPGILAAFPRKWFHFAQVCDAPANYSTEESEMIRIARSERLYLGEGGIDVAAITQQLPALPFSIEIPNSERLAQLGPELYARRCLESARNYVAASAQRRAS
jgi:sugar phosphate isomerase/epimerase